MVVIAALVQRLMLWRQHGRVPVKLGVKADIETAATINRMTQSWLSQPSRMQDSPVPLPLHACVCEDVLVVAPGGVGQVHLGALQELGNEVCTHSQGACA